MPVILQVSLRSSDLSLLAIAFPQIRVLHGPPFPMFLADRRLIVVNDDQPFLHYADREVIQVTRYAKLALDSRAGFLKFLRESCDTKITAYQRDVMLNEDEVDDERFVEELEEHHPSEQRQAVEVAVKPFILAHYIPGGFEKSTKGLGGGEGSGHRPD